MFEPILYATALYNGYLPCYEVVHAPDRAVFEQYSVLLRKTLRKNYGFYEVTP